MNIITKQQSEYFKKYNPYFWTKTEYGRDADTIILYTLKTPAGKLSKYHATLRFNSTRNVKNKIEQAEKYLEEIKTKTFKKELKEGYQISEIILYSGSLD